MNILRFAVVAVALLFPVALSAQYSASNSYLSLTGSGYVSVPNSSALNYDLLTNGQISIDAWVRPTASGTQMTIVGNDLNMGYWFGLTPQGKLRFNPNPSLFWESNASIPGNTWTHVAVSFNAQQNSLVFYINGAVDRTVSTQQTYLGYAYFDLRIGADRTPNGPAYYWTGGIDEVRIWNSVINFSTALGLLYRIPHGVTGGLHGRYLKGGWRLNGDAQSIGGNVNGSTVGAVSYLIDPDPPHYPRIAVIFRNNANDNDWLAVAPNNAFASTVQYTVECWVFPVAGGSTQSQTFVSVGNSLKNTWQFWLGLNKTNGRVRFMPTGVWSQATESNTTLPMNTWTHVAARFSPGPTGGYSAVIFLNGVEAGRSSYSSPGTSVSEPLFFGASDTRGGNGFSGVLDEVRIWNVARSDEQIADHHRMELDGPMFGLVGSYHFDGDVLDESGNGHNGIPQFPSASVAYFTDASSIPSLASLALVTPVGGERWEIGTTQRIRWSAQGLVNVRLELSRDGGSTFNEVITPSTPASAGQFDWLVSGPSTLTAVVRVRPPSTSLLEQSSGNVIIEDPVPLLDVNPRQLVFNATANGPLPAPQKVTIRNIGGAQLNWDATPMQGIWMSVDPTSGVLNDDSLTVRMLSTQLPVGQYSDRITIGGNAVNAGIQINVIYNISPAISYDLSGAVTYPTGAPIEGVLMKLEGTENRTTHTDANGKYSFVGLGPGDYTVIPFDPLYDFQPISRMYAPLTSSQTGVNFSGILKQGGVRIRYKQGWNLISLPLNLPGATVASLFPHATSPAYEYIPEAGYVEAPVLEFGKGYWLKFSRTDSVTVSGAFSPILQLTLPGTFGGWALIGVPSGPVHIADILQNPAGSLLAVYGYDPDSGYFIPPDGVLRPGRAYFVKVNTAAVLKLISAVLSNPVWRPY